MCPTFWIHEIGRIGCDSNYGFCGRWKNFLNLDLHEDKIIEPSVKTRLQNYLCEHLDLVVQMFTQFFYIVDTFLYNDAIIAWIEEKTKRSLLTWCILVSMPLGKSLLPSSHLIFFGMIELMCGLHVRMTCYH
jgi:hypothetical protein